MNTENAASTPVEELQRQREEREARRAQERSRDQQQKLRATGRESRTSYGAVLMQHYAETIGVCIDAHLGDNLGNPHKAGPFFKYWELLLPFHGGGPRSIAAIVLGVVIDQISANPLRDKLAVAIGRALQDEMKAVRLHDEKGVVLLEALRKKFGRKAVSEKFLERLRIDPSGWDLDERRGLGNLLLEVIAVNTDLIAFRKEKKELVVATDAVLELIKSKPPLPLPIRDLPSLIPPEPWEGPMRGTKHLVGSRAPMDRRHLTQRSLATAIQVVNRVEQQELVVDPWMVQVQREAWDCNLPVVFTVRREPESRWVMPEEAAQRLRTEEAIRQGEEVAGRPIWLKHDMDFRGRLYCCSRMAGHQGPDHQKALISFAQRERMDDDAVDQLLAAAAGHYGLGHSSWGERVQWGRAHLDQMAATAASPLDRFDLWKSADDPWQYLQACRAIADFLEDEATPIGCPVRYDQTASGMGIIGALTRDETLCRRTNMIGSTRSDLYAVIAAAVQDKLRMHLDSWDPFEVRMAEFWLKHPIDRSLAKAPTMTMVYGAKHFGLVEQMVSWLQERNPDVPVSCWQREYTTPAKYMTKVFFEVLEKEMASCVAVEKWLREVSRRCISKQKRIQWQSPLGFPLAFGAQLDEKQRTHTKIHGSRRWQRVDADVQPGELSARATNRGITANTVHAFDAALVHAVVLRCALVDAPLLSNHDCFATIPSRATWLHRELLLQLRQLYLPEWLADLRVEIGRNAGVHLPHPPIVGDLCEAAIGENPYCFC